MAHLREVLEDAYQQVRDRLERVQKRQKYYYDLKTSGTRSQLAIRCGCTKSVQREVILRSFIDHGQAPTE